MNSEANHIAPTDSAPVEGTDSVRESTLPDTTTPGGESGSYAGGGGEATSSHTQEEETLESQLEEINAPGDHGLCMYMSEQVAWLRYLAPRFQEALWNNTTQGFMGSLYRSWFCEWPEEPGNVLRHENSLRRFMLVVSAELTPNLTMPMDLNFRLRELHRE